MVFNSLAYKMIVCVRSYCMMSGTTSFTDTWITFERIPKLVHESTINIKHSCNIGSTYTSFQNWCNIIMH